MTFSDWRQLSPNAAAREIHARIAARLSPAQQRAALAYIPAEPQLAADFTAQRTSAPPPPRSSDAPSANPNHAPLSGIPFFAKDLFDSPAAPTFAGSTFLPEVRPSPRPESALLGAFRHAGAVFAGKTHMHEFAYGITGENPHYGDCEHPQFPGRTTGGSSSGSAAAVAAGIVPLALGSDTGGSVRLPAAFCGLFGFRLTPGDPWISDAFPLSPTFDTAGWFTANAADMRATISALVGTARAARPPRGCFLEMGELDPDVAQAFRTAAAQLTSAADATTRDELLGAFARAIDTYNTIVAFDAWEVHQSWAERYRDRYDPGVWQRLNRVHTMSRSNLDAARGDLAAVRTTWKRFFSAYDFLVLPASPTPALTKAECTLANRTRILTLTAPASNGGLPVLALPVPLPSGLTTGLQIVVPDVKSPVIDAILSAK